MECSVLTAATLGFMAVLGVIYLASLSVLVNLAIRVLRGDYDDEAEK
jgi:hypothetical protein